MCFNEFRCVLCDFAAFYQVLLRSYEVLLRSYEVVPRSYEVLLRSYDILCAFYLHVFYVKRLRFL